MVIQTASPANAMIEILLHLFVTRARIVTKTPQQLQVLNYANGHQQVIMNN